MAKVALCFLGTGDYDKLNYVWTENGIELEYETDLFAEAVNAWFNPDKLYVFVTEKVRKGVYLKRLQEKCGEKVIPVDIPDGQTEDELWEIFDIFVNNVEAGDSLILDITYGYRTLPLLGFAVSVFLKRIRDVKIEKIVYGAAKKEELARTPVFDMTPLAELMDWLEGLDAFKRRADARELACLLKHAKALMWKDRVGDAAPEFDKISSALSDLTYALHLSRPLKVMGYANKAASSLTKVGTKEEYIPQVRPFILLLQEITEVVNALAHGHSKELSADNLRCQLKLIDYYLKKELLVQAITLMREWLVNLLGLEINKDSWLTKEGREQIECVLNNCNPDIYVPGIKKVWDEVRSLRNDIAHCGMKHNPTGPFTIMENAKKMYERLVELQPCSAPATTSTTSITIDVSELYQGQAKLADLDTYIRKVRETVGEGAKVVLTGSGPIWLYLKIAHALHGQVCKLSYSSPVTGEVVVFDHNPF